MEIAFIKFLQNFCSPFMDGFMRFITMTAEEGAIFFAILICYYVLSKKEAVKLFALYVTGGAAVQILKRITLRPRPSGVKIITNASGYAFPSAHSFSATVLFLYMANAIGYRFKKIKPIAFYVASVMILLVAISRIYLGVHFVTDCLGGIALAVIWLIIGNFLFEKIKDYHKITVLIVPVMVLIFIFSLTFAFNIDVQTVNSFSIYGIITGFFLGHYIDINVYGEQKNKNFLQAVFKLLIALPTAVFLIYLISLVPQIALVNYLLTFALGLILTIVMSFVFDKIFYRKLEVK